MPRHAHRGEHAAPVSAAAAELAAGRPIVLTSDQPGFHTGQLVLSAQDVSTEQVAFLVRNTSGFLCAPLAGEICDRLDLPPMRVHNEGPYQTQFTVSVDAVGGISTGISAHDRAMTARRLADDRARAEDFTRPGHVVPIRAHDGGIRARSGYAEAAVELCRRAGHAPAAVMSDIVSEQHPTEMANRAELLEFAHANRLVMVRVEDLTRDAGQLSSRRLFDVTVSGPPAPIRLVGFAADDGELGYVVARPVAPADTFVAAVDIRVCCAVGMAAGDTGCSCVSDLHTAIRGLPADGSRVVVHLTRPAPEHRPLHGTTVQVGALLADLGLRTSTHDHIAVPPRLARRRSAESGRTRGIGSGANSMTEVPCQ